MFLPGLCWIEPTFDFLLKNPRICPTQQNVNLRQNSRMVNYDNKFGGGCGAVGRAVASDIRGPPFESSHRQIL